MALTADSLLGTSRSRPRPGSILGLLRRRDPVDVLLTTLLVLTVGTSPLEGYLLRLSPYATKVVPTLFVVAWATVRATRRVAPRITVAGWLALALMAAVLCSSALNTGNPFTLGYVIRWLPFLVLVVVIADVVQAEVSAVVAVNALALGAVAAAAGALYSFVVLGAPRATGPLSDPNDLAYVLVTALPLLVLARRRPAPWWETALRSGGVLLLAGGMAVTVSRGAAVALTVLALWAAAHHLVSLRAAVVVGLVALVLGLAAYLGAQAQVRSALGQKAYVAGLNIQTRELRWEAAGRELAAAPLFGQGPGGVRQNYVAFSRDAELDVPDPVTHNMYLEVGAELGLVGLGLFVAVVAAGIVASARVPARLTRLGLGLQGSLVAALAASTFLSEEYYMALWAPIAIAAGLAVRPPTSDPRAGSRAGR
jgi:putative inorganic carbon (HCO3(-)) transporter